MLTRKTLLDLDKRLAKYISNIIGYDLLNKELIQVKPIAIQKDKGDAYNINIAFTLSGYLDAYNEAKSYILKEKAVEQIRKAFIDIFEIASKKVDDLNTHDYDFRIDMRIEVNEDKLIDISTLLKLNNY